MKKTILQSCLAVAFGFMAATGDAQAANCSITASCEMTTMRESQAVQSRISAMESSISSAVYQIGNDIVSAIANSTSGITGALAKNAASTSNNAAQMDQVNRHEREEQTRSAEMTQCGQSSSAQGPRSGGSMSPKPSNGPGSGYVPSSVDDRFLKVMNQAGVTDVPQKPSISPEEKMADVGEGGCKTFSDPKTWRGFVCALIGADSRGLNPYKDADIRAETLFDGPVKPGGRLKNLSIPASGGGAERDAREAYLTMLNGASIPALPQDDHLKSQKGKEYMGARAEYEAAQSLARYPSNQWDRLTTADPDTLPGLKAINKSDPAFLQQYTQGMDPRSWKDGVSPLVMLDLEVERRIGNPEWLKRMAAATEQDKAAEQLMIAAYSMRMHRDMYLAQMQTNVLLGKFLQNSSEARYRERLDGMRAELAAAKARELVK